MIVQIKSVIDGTYGDKKYKEITYTNTATNEDGKKRIWEELKDKWPALTVGNVVQLTFKAVVKDGKTYQNVIGIEQSSAPEAVKKDQTATYATKAIDRNERNESIDTAVAFKGAVEMLTSYSKNTTQDTALMYLFVTSFIKKHCKDYVEFKEESK